MKNASAAAAKLLKCSTLSDDEIRETQSKLIEWVNAQSKGDGDA